MRTKEEMAAYQKARREKLRGRVDPLDEAITSVKKLVVVDRGSLMSGVAPCVGCAEMEIKNGILRGRVLMLETALCEAKKLIPPKPDSPYRGF